MSTLFASLQSASNSLDVFEQEMGVIQNNVTNASTPGYVTQSLDLISQSLQPSSNMWGGVEAGPLESSRNQFAEESVWNQNQLLGSATQESSSLSALQSAFDVSGNSGIPGALSNLYSAFSAWSAAPADSTSRQQVLTGAQQLAQAFNEAAMTIQGITSQTNQQLTGTVDQINQLAGEIASINAQIRSDQGRDPALEARLYSTLEQLSNLAGITVQQQSDGTVAVYMGGETALVMGESEMQLQISYSSSGNSNAPGNASITTATGQDITAYTTQGQLGGLLQIRNSTLPAIIGGGQQQGSLNQLAQAVADRVNTLLTSGQVSSGPPAVSGVPLFTYNSNSPMDVASTLSMNPNITASQLAAIDPGPPPVSNGIANQLAQLANPQDPADMLNGTSYTDFYGGIASEVGSQAASASAAQNTQTQLLAQAQNMRSQVSGVSLNDQAAKLLQFQQAYEASAQLITVINSTAQFFMNSMQNS